MTLFEQSIFNYFIAASAIAGFAVLWRNWLTDHPRWREWLERNMKGIVKIFTCGSCFTYWITLAFVIVLNPLNIFWLIQWMSIGWGALFLRFLYIALQEHVSLLVHRHEGHDH